VGEKLRRFFGFPSLSAFFTVVIGFVIAAVIMTTVLEGKSPLLKVVGFVAFIFVIRGVGELVRYLQKKREQR